MSLNFSDLGGLDREIRCLVVQGFNRKIKYYYDDFESVKQKFGSKVVTVYEPNAEQKNMILDLLIESIVEDENGKEEIKIDGSEFLVTLIDELTDINLNLSYENEEDRKQIEKILDKPSKLLFAIHSEIRTICNEIFDMLYQSLIDLNERPQGMREALLMRFNEENKVEEVKEEETQEEFQEEVQEENNVENISQEENGNE